MTSAKLSLTSSAGLSKRKSGADDLADFVKPRHALVGRAEDDRFEIAAVEVFDAAEVEYARLPKIFQGIAEEAQFVLARGIRGGENHCLAAFQQPINSLSCKFIS